MKVDGSISSQYRDYSRYDARRRQEYHARQHRRGVSARASRRRAPKRKAILLVVLVTLVGMFVAMSLETQGCAPVSTPVSQWERGEMPYLYQTDAQWANKRYAGDTIGKSGCGPTCLSMAYIMLTGDKGYGPVEMARYSEEQGYVMDGATAWALMTDGADGLGISGREIPASPSVVSSELEDGHPVICSMRPGDFTTTGHFIVLSGMDDDGHVRVHDPNSVANSKKAWSLDTVLEQCKGIWALSA